MNKFVVWILIMQLSVLVFADEPDKVLHKKCLYPTVMIQSFGGEKDTTGTGVIVSSKKVEDKEKYENIVVTCAHILCDQVEGKQPPRFDVMTGKYRDWSRLVNLNTYAGVEVLVKDNEKDIAILKFCSVSQMPTAEIERHPKLFIGNEVFRIGCGLENPFRLDYGKITCVIGSENSARGTYRTSILTLPGDSGGPVYNDNKLVGIMQSIEAVDEYHTQPINFMSHFMPIERYLLDEDAAKYLGE